MVFQRLFMFLSFRFMSILFFSLKFMSLKYFILVISFVLASSAVSAILVTEIMYDPEGDDALYEFVELFFDHETNLSGYYFEGIDFRFPESSTVRANYTMLLARSRDPFVARYGVIPDFLFQGSLRNSGESISIFAAHLLRILQINYSDTAREDHSLEWRDEGIDAALGGFFVASSEKGGSPGVFSRSSDGHPLPSSNASLDLNHSETAFPNQTINQTMILVPNPYQDTLNTGRNESKERCSPIFDIVLDKEFYLSGEHVLFTPVLTGVPKGVSRELRYFVEDSQGAVIKKEQVTTSLTQKQYTPQIKKRKDIHYLHTELKLGCRSDPLQRIVPILIENRASSDLAVSGIPVSAHYGDTLSLAVRVLPPQQNDSIGSLFSGGVIGTGLGNTETVFSSLPLRVMLANETLFSLAIDDYYEGNLSVTIPASDCQQAQSSTQGTLSVTYGDLRVEKTLLLLPSAACDLPQLRKLYTLTSLFEAGKNISLFVSFEVKDIRENDTLVFVHTSSTRLDRSPNPDERVILDDVLSPLRFYRVLDPGVNLFSAELWRVNHLIDRKELNITTDVSDLDGSVGASRKGSSSQAGDEMFKKELGLLGSATTERTGEGKGIPQVPFLYYVIFGISLSANVILLWKS